MLTVYTDDDLFLLEECQLHSNSSLCAVTHVSSGYAFRCSLTLFCSGFLLQGTVHTAVEVPILRTLESIHVLLSGYSNHSVSAE